MGDVVELIDPRELVGRHEIAERAGVALKTIDTWRGRYDTFPDPLLYLSGSPLWLWPTVEAWIRETPREVGRPSSAPLPDPIHEIPPRLARAIRTDPPAKRADTETETA